MDAITAACMCDDARVFVIRLGGVSADRMWKSFYEGGREPNMIRDTM